MIRHISLFSFRANWEDREMDGEGDATIGRGRCEQEPNSRLSRCAAGTGTVYSFTAPRHLPHCPKSSIIMMNWISLSPPLSFLEQDHGRLMGICLYILKQ